MLGRRILLVGGFAAGMGGLLSGRTQGHMIGTDQQLRLVTRFETKPATLILHYSVENKSSLDVYLLNRLHSRQYEVNPDLVYIDLNRPQKLVCLYKKIPPFPPGPSPIMPISPFVTPVRAGTHFMETVHIHLPIQEWTGYSDIEQGKDVKSAILYHSIHFAVQYYWSVPGMKEAGDVVNGVPVIIPTPPPGTKLNFGILSSSVVSLDVTVSEE